MDIRRKDGKTVIKLFRPDEKALTEAHDVTDTIAAQDHPLAPLAKQVADGLAELRKQLAAEEKPAV